MKRVALKKHSPKRTKAAGKPKTPSVTVSGKRMPDFSAELVLIRTARFKSARSATKPSEEARFLVRRAGEALREPGIVDQPMKKKRSLYSADPANPLRIVRRSAGGKTSSGRLVGYRFRTDD